MRLWWFVEKKDQIKWSLQRLFRGYADVDIWGLDICIAEFVLPRLKVFRENLSGHPAGIEFEDWKEWLDKMIYAMQTIHDEGHFRIDTKDIDFKKQQEGLELFGKYFLHLWD